MYQTESDVNKIKASIIHGALLRSGLDLRNE